VTIYLMADAVLSGKAQQKTPDRYYDIEQMLKRVLSRIGIVLLCGTCTDACGTSAAELMDGASHGVPGDGHLLRLYPDRWRPIADQFLATLDPQRR
jgi:hypothetical protein